MNHNAISTVAIARIFADVTTTSTSLDAAVGARTIEPPGAAQQLVRGIGRVLARPAPERIFRLPLHDTDMVDFDV